MLRSPSFQTITDPVTNTMRIEISMASNTTVLVVDDDPRIQRYLRASLAAAGYQPAAATTSAEALKVLEEQAPDILVLVQNLLGHTKSKLPFATSGATSRMRSPSPRAQRFSD